MPHPLKTPLWTLAEGLGISIDELVDFILVRASSLGVTPDEDRLRREGLAPHEARLVEHAWRTRAESSGSE